MTKKTEDLELIIFKANLSEHARFFIENFLSDLKYENKKKFDDDKLFDCILCSEEFIYYSDAFNYLMDEHINDFSEAISNNYYDVSQIAEFYLQKELLEKIFYKL